jgi:hypothetical protein
MKVKIDIKKKHIAYLIISIAIVGGISYAVAQSSPNPGHDPQQIGPGTFFGSSSDTWEFPGTVQANEFIGAVPQGSIMAFNLLSCPAGWTLADGTSNTPDLRGMFIRGLDDGSAGNDPEAPRALGSIQDDDFEEHSHTLTYSNVLIGGGGTGVSAMQGTIRNRETELTGGDETRPRNVALIYCVKL